MAELLNSVEFNPLFMRNYFFTKRNKRIALLVLMVAGLSFVSYSPAEKQETKPVAEKGILLKGAEKNGYSEMNIQSL